MRSTRATKHRQLLRRLSRPLRQRLTGHHACMRLCSSRSLFSAPTRGGSATAAARSYKKPLTGSTQLGPGGAIWLRALRRTAARAAHILFQALCSIARCHGGGGSRDGCARCFCRSRRGGADHVFTLTYDFGRCLTHSPNLAPQGETRSGTHLHPPEALHRKYELKQGHFRAAVRELSLRVCPQDLRPSSEQRPSCPCLESGTTPVLTRKETSWCDRPHSPPSAALTA